MAEIRCGGWVRAEGGEGNENETYFPLSVFVFVCGTWSSQFCSDDGSITVGGKKVFATVMIV